MHDDAHDAKDGLGDSRLDLYVDKKTGDVYVWDGNKKTEPQLIGTRPN
jgi:hypothetical protein